MISRVTVTLMAGEMVPYKHEELMWDSEKLMQSPGLMVCTYNLGTVETKTKGSQRVTNQSA